MSDSIKIPNPHLGEPFLLTPGPLTTSYEDKQAMLRDWGSWDDDFRAMTVELREGLLALTGDTKGVLDCVPIQGSGTFAVEAMIGTFVPKGGHVLVLANGAYGMRSAETVERIGLGLTLINKGDYMPPRGEEVAAALAADPTITHVIVAHCETSSGILNPVQEIADAVHGAGRKFLIDSMSAFGAVDLDFEKLKYEAMVSSANKCIEGVPGFGFVVARKDALEAAKDNCHSFSLDMHAQWTTMNKTGQWRFTPPTHVVAAFLVALAAHKAEGAVAGRGARYTRNRDVMVEGMRDLGFETLLQDRWLSPIIVTFFCPADEKFVFSDFYNLMKHKGFIIYPGKLTVVDSFRVGCIGQMDEHIMLRVVAAAKDTLDEMGVADATPPKAALIERAKLAA